MLKMRLQRVGRKHEPSFRLVLTESKNSTKSGRFGEILGSYDPRKSTEFFKADRIKHWLSQGVLLTPTVNNLLVRHGIMKGKKIDVSAGSAPVVASEPAPVVESPVEPVAEASPEISSEASQASEVLTEEKPPVVE